jgi:hypothetical protein
MGQLCIREFWLVYMYGLGFGDEAVNTEGHVIFAARRRFVSSDFRIIFISQARCAY